MTNELMIYELILVQLFIFQIAFIEITKISSFHQFNLIVFLCSFKITKILHTRLGCSSRALLSWMSLGQFHMRVTKLSWRLLVSRLMIGSRLNLNNIRKHKTPIGWMYKLN